MTTEKEQLYVESGRRMEDLTREQKTTFDALSKELFGASSRWVKLVKNGRYEQVTEEVTEYVPGEKEEDEGITRKVQVPVKKNGMSLSTLHRFTVDEVESYMLRLKAQLEAFKEMIAKQKAEQEKAKAQAELTAKVQDQVAGSAI